MRFARTSKSALAEKLSSIIYVEGQDDAWLINELLDELNADPANVGIVYIKGTGAIENEISFLLKSASYVQRQTLNIAFLIDADLDAAKTTADLNSLFHSKGLPAASHASTVGYDTGRNLALFVFPDGEAPGEIEDLLLATVTEDDRLTTVTNALLAVESVHGTLAKRSKRIARMYISVLNIKPCGVGRAYCEGVFNKDHVWITAVRQFLQGFIGL